MFLRSILLFVIFCTGVTAGTAQTRHALVIGNDSYPGSALKNARNDASAVFGALRQVGYVSTLILDANRSSMSSAIDQFVDSINPGDTAVLYYAGHGLQVDGENFLVPTDFKVTSPSDAKVEGYALSSILERFTSHGATTQIIILDACRDNPFMGERSTKGGWAGMGTSAGAFLAFGTSPGSTASDDPGDGHGLFTKDLLSYLTSSNLDIEEMFRKVREDVIRDSNGQQVPWVASSLIGSFHVLPGLDTGTRLLPARDDRPSSSISIDMRSIGHRQVPVSEVSPIPLPPPALQKFGQAVSLARGAHFNDAIVLLQDLLAIAPGFSPGLRLLGLLLHEAGRDAEAINAFNRALSVDVGDADASAERCAVEVISVAANSETDCEMAVQDSPTAQTYLVLAVTEHSRGQNTQAYSLITQSIDLQPTDLSLTFRGVISAQQNSSGSADRDFARAAQLNASLPVSR
jgi:Flp pilus assembly protein TadD